MTGIPDPTDEHLAMLVQKGDKEKFGVLMERYEAKLFRYARKFLSGHANIEDVVQDVFIKTYQSIQSFDTSQKFSPWIYRIAHNTFVNQLKRFSKSRLSFFDFDTFIPHAVYEDTAMTEQEQAEMKKMVDKGLEMLSPDYKEIVILYYLEELSYKEIADVLRIPVGTVGVRIRRAKESLRKAYQKLNIQFEK
jgi:RNA polymerase sigma-70 factor, ECF subfamily